MNIFEFGNSYKTQLVGLVAVVSGIVTMLTSGGDPAVMQTGWAQVLGGLIAIFLRQGVKKAENAAENVIPADKFADLEAGKTVTVTVNNKEVKVIKVNETTVM